MDEQTSSRKKEVWTYVLIVVSVVALGIVFAGLLEPRTEPDLTTTPTSRAPAFESVEPAEPVEYDMVEEPVDLTQDIPGCDAVEASSPATYGSFASVGDEGYDNPTFPWFSGPKATEMSTAVVDSLPSGAVVEFASPEQSFVFQPIMDLSDPDQEPIGVTIASGSLVNGDGRGAVNVQVQQTFSPIPPCVAGSLDERRTLPDGVVVDVHDTWQEVNGVRTFSRTARAYVADGSLIYVNASDRFGRSFEESSGTVPLTIDDLVRIVADPRLRVSTAVPPGTPAPSEGCHAGSFDESGPPITREQAKKLDIALATVDLGDQRLKPLQLSEYSNDTLCTESVDATSRSGLAIVIMGRQPLPTAERPTPGSGSQATLRTLGDGTVVQTDRSFGSVSPTDAPGDAGMETINSVVVTRPAGTQISVRSSAATSADVLSLEKLESIALTPGLEL